MREGKMLMREEQEALSRVPKTGSISGHFSRKTGVFKVFRIFRALKKGFLD
jgi:hypothetical protein